MTKYLVTGATGQLGGLVLDALQGKIDTADIAVLTRTPEAQAAFAARGYDARLGDYNDPDALTAAFAGIDRLLLISGSEIGQRVAQHTNAINAAKAAGVSYIAYTSLLKADTSAVSLAPEHLATEQALAASGIAHTNLRNGWYTENYTAGLPQVLGMGQHFGAAGSGTLNAAPRKDYAAAAAVVLATPGHEGKTYELAGDDAFSLSDYAATVAELSGKEIAYVDMPTAQYAEALVGAGLPAPLAGFIAEADERVAQGWLATPSRDLSTLIGRPTTPLRDTVAEAVAALADA